MTSSCDPDASIMLHAGGVCAGFGTCVNSTINPSQLLCRCNTGYSGASDFFDSRVEQLPDGTYLSLTCGRSDVGTYLAWAIVGALGLVRVKQLVPVFLRFYRKYKLESEKGAHPGYFQDFALQLVTFDLFVVTSFYFLLVICQLCGLTLGTDIAPTIALPLVVFFFNVVQYRLTKREFSIFIKSTMSTKQARKAEHFRNVLKICSLGGYFVATATLTFWTLSLDKSLGPIQNLEFIAIIGRNVGTLAWGIAELATTAMVRRQILATLALSASDSNQPSDEKSRSSKLTSPVSSASNAVYNKRVDLDQKTTQVVKRMEAEIKALMIFLFSTGMLYGTFLIPYLYPFQTYCIAFVVGTGALRHSGKSFQVQQPSQHSGAVAAAEGSAENQPTGVIPFTGVESSAHESAVSTNARV